MRKLFGWKALATAWLMVAFLVLLGIFPYFLDDYWRFRQAGLEEEAERSRVVDLSSPAYRIAQILAGTQWDIVQCDGNPSVHTDGHSGYRILLRQTFSAVDQYFFSSPRVTKRMHLDFVLFPAQDGATDKLLRSLRWEGVEMSRPEWHRAYGKVRARFLGDGFGYSWYARLTESEQEDIRSVFDLGGADLAFEEAVQQVWASEKERERNQALDSLADIGEKTIPMLMREIDCDVNGSAGAAVFALGRIPGDHVTEVLLSLEENQKIRWEVRCTLLREPFRQGAKAFYLKEIAEKDNILYSSAVNAALQFVWDEALPLLEARSQSTSSIWEYDFLRRAIRKMQGNPIPQELCDCEATISGLSTVWSSKEPSPQEVQEAKERIVSHSDKEAAVLIALRFASEYGKCNYRPVNEIGLELLQGLPDKMVLPILEQLAANGPDGFDQARITPILAALRPSDEALPQATLVE